MLTCAYVVPVEKFIAWVGGRPSPSRSCLLRRRTDRHHPARVPSCTGRWARRSSRQGFFWSRERPGSD